MKVKKKKEIQEIELTTKIVDGKMIAIASDESKDRVGDSLKTDDWNFKNFKKNPVLQAGHDYRPQFTIGIAKNLQVEGSKVVFEPVFHSITALGREIKEMFEQGILKAWSVGFIPGRKEGVKNELLEISAVAVPANANALVIAKGMKPDEEKEIKEKIEEFVTKEKPKKKKKKIEKKEKVKEDKKKDDKSPACRMDDETAKECVSRKIPELVDEGMEQDQAVAAATKICKTKCESKKEVKKSKKKIPADVKEGRIISSKNRKVIADAISASKDAVAALEKLFELSEPAPKEEPEKAIQEESVKKVKKDTPKKAEGNDNNQGRNPRVAHKQPSTEDLVVRVLKQINQNSSFMLGELKK